MTPDDFRNLTDEGTFPMVLQMRSGKSIPLRTRHTFFISDDYPEMVIVTRPGRGVVFVVIEAIDAIRTEREVVVQ